MSYDINQVFLIGRLATDVELRTTSNGKSVGNFTIAVNNDSSSEKKNASFMSVTIWDKIADNCSRYLSKGSQVAVSGRLKQEKWANQDGQNRSKVVIIANQVEFLQTSSGNQSQTSGYDSNY